MKWSTMALLLTVEGMYRRYFNIVMVDKVESLN